VAADNAGDTPLHLAASHGQPMVAYAITKARPDAPLARNARGQRACDVAAACGRGEVLNAMLLGCAGDGGAAAVAAMRELLAAGAVPDTWAPNGSSALMLAASVDSGGALAVLLEGGASVELQDALGRWAPPPPRQLPPGFPAGAARRPGTRVPARRPWVLCSRAPP
jgi:ankyrin repeat protein